MRTQRPLGWPVRPVTLFAIYSTFSSPGVASRLEKKLSGLSPVSRTEQFVSLATTSFSNPSSLAAGGATFTLTNLELLSPSAAPQTILHELGFTRRPDVDFQQPHTHEPRSHEKETKQPTRVTSISVCCQHPPFTSPHQTRQAKRLRETSLQSST